MPLTLLIGGARSGKSSLALRLAEGEVVFIATGEAGDAEMAERIDAHRAERPPSWRTVEAPIDLTGALRDAPPDACVIVDCLTLWVANTMDEARAREAAALAVARPGQTIAVTNEVGLGIVPANELARSYRDLLGRVNTIWAEAADRVLLVVAGRTLELT
jgi:adenosylcobinamide kinase / adenosylcobinamide-phosphate guanylyltransferase